MSSQLLVERQGQILKLILNRPEKGNSLTPVMLEQLAHHLGKVSSDREIRAIIISGAGDWAFSTGFDISKIGRVQNKPGIELEIQETAYTSIRSCPVPVIAMINGYTMGGGCDLMLNCDLSISSQKAKFAMPPAKLGVIYSPEGMERFVRAIGVTNTKYLFYSGRIISAAEALDMGLVNRVVDQKDLEQVTLALAEEIAANAPLTVRAVKEMLGKLSAEYSKSAALRSSFSDWIEKIFTSEDCREGKQAFLEKRNPIFRGK
ncbi:MAG TPA: enoyl-CoA hydratase-related protein [Desulfitobacteriaceae bacterium]|nr:enoyl-CoA hydratase-related protein [Desulfitobacteriaceae bacterium]